MTKKDKAKTDLNYDESVQEIELILKLIEDGSLGVDELAEKVARVSSLLKSCREKLYSAEQQVKTILNSEDED